MTGDDTLVADDDRFGIRRQTLACGRSETKTAGFARPFPLKSVAPRLLLRRLPFLRVRLPAAIARLRRGGRGGLRGLGRQRRWTVRLLIEIGDHVGALTVAQAGEGHGGARNEGLRAGQELVELLDGPFAGQLLHRGGIVEA